MNPRRLIGMVLLVVVSSAAPAAAPNPGVQEAPATASRERSGPTPEDFNLAFGEAVFTDKCLSCHGTGVEGAPVPGSVAEWEKRLDQDLDTLIRHALSGHGRMPPKGGSPELSDSAVAAAVAYVVSESAQMIAGLEQSDQPDQCHPARNPDACDDRQLRRALILHMLWLLNPANDGP